MNEGENFVARWSRRKRASAQENEQESESPEQPVGTAAEAPLGGEDRPRSAADADVQRTDTDATPVAQLPPLESIVAESDVRAFLARGVPPELTRAALRRAWSADPKIRDFIGLSENSWDFNDPAAMPGFGPLELTDELRREIARMIGRSLGEEASEGPAPSPPDRGLREPEPPPAQAASTILPPPAGSAPQPLGPAEPVQVAQRDPASEPDRVEERDLPSKRRHGSALPQ